MKPKHSSQYSDWGGTRVIGVRFPAG
jgi:hypothetical protein